MIDYYVQGFGRKVAAEKAGISIKVLNNELRKRGISSHHYNKSITPEKIVEIQMNKQLGYTYKALSQKYGVSYSSIRRYCAINIAL